MEHRAAAAALRSLLPRLSAAVGLRPEFYGGTEASGRAFDDLVRAGWGELAAQRHLQRLVLVFF